MWEVDLYSVSGKHGAALLVYELIVFIKEVMK